LHRRRGVYQRPHFFFVQRCSRPHGLLPGEGADQLFALGEADLAGEILVLFQQALQRRFFIPLARIPGVSLDNKAILAERLDRIAERAADRAAAR
jgi:hypothetical protein